MSCILGRLIYRRLYYIKYNRFIFRHNARLSTLLDTFSNVISNKNESNKLSNNNNNKNNNIQESQKPIQDELFEPYWSSIDMDLFIQNNPKFVVNGTVSIPAFNTSDSYIKSKGTTNKIFGFIARNRAFHGDLVEAIKIRRTKSESNDSDKIDPSDGCRVVRIIKRNPQIYKLVGTLKHSESNKNNYLRVQPRDHRFPAFIIPHDTMDTCILNMIKDSIITKKSYICTFTFHSWDVNSIEPTAKLLNIIGESGNSKAEADALVNYYGFNHLEFNEDILKECELITSIPDVNRIDLTNINVFSIDPPTAKDLDDAISIDTINGTNNYRIGVHIADVCHYVKPYTHIDMEAKTRCTTVYLDHFVYPMLPRKLSEDLCSLLPGDPKKCFSVLFDFNVNSSCIENIKFYKSLLKSRFKLSYDMAEDIINGEKCNVEIPNDISERVKLLFKVSQLLKDKRIAHNKGIRINSDCSEQLYIPLVDNVCLDDNQYPRLEMHQLHPKSHSLIEELMVLTNRLVAEHLLKHYKLSLFRIHQDTSNEVRAHLIKHIPQNVLENLKFDINTVPIQTLLNKCKEYIDSYEYDCLNFIALQRFKEASYIASEKDIDDNIQNKSLLDLSHWGLGIDAYLHFTSPIRRYADIITHRLLEDSLTERNLYNYDCEIISRVADNCNVKKRLAFDAQIEYKSLILNKYLQWANTRCNDSILDGFIKCYNSDVYGYKSQGVIKELIFPSIIYSEVERLCNVKFKTRQSDKAALSIYVPFLRQTRSLSLDTLNLESLKATFQYKSCIYTFTFVDNKLELDSDQVTNTTKDSDILAISLACKTLDGKNYVFKPMSSTEIILIPGSQMWSLRLY